MSSTNRGRARNEYDYYRTPEWVINDFINNINTDIGMFVNDESTQSKSILDPCAGGDSINSMSYVEVLRNFGFSVNSIDLRKDSRAEIKTNFLEYNTDKKWDIIITNPPYKLATEFIEKSMSLVHNNGYVIMLLRLNFFESIKRKVFFDNYMPEFCYTHRKRISFTTDGKSDSVPNAHFIWKKGYNPEFTKLKII